MVIFIADQDCLSQPPIISSIVSRLTGDDRLDVLQPGLTQDIFSSADDRNNLSIAPSKIVFCLSRILPDKVGVCFFELNGGMIFVFLDSLESIY